MSVVSLPFRARLQAHLVASHRKGRVLSHLLGIVLASEFLLGTAAGRSIPYVNVPMFTAWLDFPIRMIALWLILDRNWRIGRLKPHLWDVLALAFPVIVGLAYPFATLDPSVPTDFESYRGFVGTILRFYTIYLVVREGYNRAGFRGDIMMRYVQGALMLSALTAVAQALNIGGVRAFSQRFFASDELTRQTTGAIQREGFRARGFAAHWNTLGAEMVLGSIMVAAPLNWRRLRWYEWLIAGVLFMGLVVSTSRGALVTYFAVGVAAGGYFLWTNRKKTGLVILSIIAITGISFLGAVITLKLPLFKGLLHPSKVRSQSLGSLDYRLERARHLIEVGQEHPLTGTGPSAMLYENRTVSFWSTSSVSGVLDVTYPLVFAQFGLVGLAYIAAVIYSLVRYGARRRALHPYAAAAFLTGIAFAVDSTIEMVFTAQSMVLVSIVAALAASRVSAYSKEVENRKFAPAPANPAPLPANAAR